MQQAGEEDEIRRNLDDAGNKAKLLKNEVLFTDAIRTALEQLRDSSSVLDAAQKAGASDSLEEAVELLVKAQKSPSLLQGSNNARYTGILRERISDLRSAIVESILECWNELICVDTVNESVTIKHEIHRKSFNLVAFALLMFVGSTTITMDTVSSALTSLGLLRGRVDALCQSFNDIVLTPRLRVRSNDTVPKITVAGPSIHVSGRITDVSVESVLDDLFDSIRFLDSSLPEPIARLVSEVMMPGLISTLISVWLASSVPATLEDVPDFQSILAQVQSFGDSIESRHWPGKQDLIEWVHSAPKVWLNKRRESSLDTVRRTFANGLGELRTVERVETQRITRKEDIFMGSGGDDGWNQDWSDDEDEEPAEQASRSSNTMGRNNEEEDVSAWEIDDESSGQQDRIEGTHSTPDDDNDAWGWGDDYETGEPSKSTQVSPVREKIWQSTGKPPVNPRFEREITLKETYTITDLPQKILELISQILSDAKILSLPDSASSPVAPAAAGLFVLPASILSIYRASASHYYSRDLNGNMYLYNDSIWLAEQLNTLATDYDLATGTSPKASRQLDIARDISALELCGKRAYGKEMESQRTILRDLLDGAQGFANCTTYPFAQECDLAIDSTIDRLREVNRRWEGVLSHSALLQSTGSLLSTVINKVIVDVEDMGDISEPESKRLTSFCNRVAALEDLFIPRTSEAGTTTAAEEASERPLPLTAIYTSKWLKFQYLTNILESSLVDIKYLWTEGELSLEFSAAEVVDLIEALFADSEHRRKAIGEVRRRSVNW